MYNYQFIATFLCCTKILGIRHTYSHLHVINENKMADSTSPEMNKKELFNRITNNYTYNKSFNSPCSDIYIYISTKINVSESSNKGSPIAAVGVSLKEVASYNKLLILE